MKRSSTGEAPTAWGVSRGGVSASCLDLAAPAAPLRLSTGKSDKKLLSFVHNSRIWAAACVDALA